MAVATSSSASLGANPFLGGEALDLLAELYGELAVVAGDQGAPVEREVPGRERVDGPADDVSHDEVAGVDRAIVGLAGDALGPRCQRQQRRVAGEVRRGAGRRFGESARAPDGQPGAGQPEGENLIGVHLKALSEPAQLSLRGDRRPDFGPSARRRTGRKRRRATIRPDGARPSPSPHAYG